MKSILIIGKKNEGKSTTMREVCKMLNPSKVYKLNTVEKKIENAEVNDIFNNTFIIEVNEKFILVVAGAPTEQNIFLKVLIEICLEINIRISFLLVSRRIQDKINDNNTTKDLKDYSELVHTERIIRSALVDKNDKDSYKQNMNWINRITKINTMIINNLDS